MPGMDLPNPGGAMKKLSLEFADAQDAANQAQQPQIPPGAGIPPAGMQGAPQAGMQQPPPDAGMPAQGGPTQPQGPGGDIFSGMAPQGAPDSGMLSDEDLAMMSQEDPAMMAGQDMHDQLMNPQGDPMAAQQLQMQLMEAARRQMGGF